MVMKLELKDWLDSIFHTKEDLMKKYPECKNQYPAFIINRMVAGQIDCILFANEMNKFYTMDNEMQYKFYLNSIRKKKRFTPFIKKGKLDNVQTIMDHYNVSLSKAEDYLRILSIEQVQEIVKQMNKGGTK